MLPHLVASPRLTLRAKHVRCVQGSFTLIKRQGDACTNGQLGNQAPSSSVALFQLMGG